MNLENKEEIEEIEEQEQENGNNLFYNEYNAYYDKKNGYYSYDLKEIDISKYFKDISIKNIYQLENGYFIIEHENKISVVSVEDNSIFLHGDFNIKDSITCISEIKGSQVILGQNDGLVKLVFSNSDGVRKDKINDMKFNFLSSKTQNDNYYIVSCDKGTFKVSNDILSINYNDLNDQNKISDKTYDLETEIEINKNTINIFIDKNIIEIIDINNTQNYYKMEESNCHYVKSRKCIATFKTKEDSNSHIFICATKKTNEEQKNGILALKIGLPINEEKLKAFEDTKDLEIVCICPFKQNIEEEAFSPYFLFGGINENNEVEIRLNKIIDSDEQFNNYISIEFIKTVVNDNERLDSSISINQSYIDGELTIFSKKNVYKLDIQDEEEE